MVGGELLGAYCLSEPQSGSDAAALTTKAVRHGDDYVVNGTKAWITHGGEADFYALMCRTSDDGARGISCLLTPADTPGLSAGEPERKMGFKGSTTAQMHFDDARIAADRLMGDEGQGFKIALAALDGGRLGIAACAIGVAQAALDVALAYAKEREQFGRPILEFQGLSFLVADMATQIEAGRALYLDGGPASRPWGVVRQAGRDGQAVLHRHRDARHHRRRTGAGWLRLRRGLPGRAVHARGEGPADRRGHEPDPAHGHRPAPGPGLTAPVRRTVVAIGVATLSVGLLSGCGDGGRTPRVGTTPAAHSAAPPAADAVRPERLPLTPAAEAEATARLGPAERALHRLVRRKQSTDSSVVLNTLVRAGFSPDTLQVTRASVGLSPGEIGIGIFVGDGCLVGSVSATAVLLEPDGVLSDGSCLAGRDTR